MATATVTRPTNALRQRRDAPRPSLPKRQTNMDAGASEPAGKKRKLNEPYVRDSAYIFNKHKGKSPSLIIHLHQTHFRFDGQDGSFAYDSPMKFVIRHLREQTVPHEMMEDLLANNVPFYDGCLIVEVHNHRVKEGREKGRSDSGVGDGKVKFGMHNYDPHVTPSPFAPYPSKARTDGTPEKVENASASGEMPAPERPREKDGPKVTTIVLHPTSLAQHHELLILANTPTSDVRSKKRSSDGATPSSAQPPTPQLSVPPTPLSQTSRGPLSQSQKMCLEDGDFYAFQSDLLVSTEPPLYLEPVDNPQDAQRVLDMLQHPLHQDKPPSPKTRKRTTAEMAADDAQAAETERRMLIMDERIKPSGAGAAANENQGAAASLGFSRFKTIEMVRQKHEEAERIKKDEEARVALEKKHAEEQNAQAQAQQQKIMMAQRQREILMAQQQPNQQQSLMMQQRRQAHAMATAQQQAQMASQAHGHPQPNGMPPGQQQGFSQQIQTSMPQSSPVVRQQTPMKSSPMMPQDGFPMAQTSSQGAGSPPRPTSAVSQRPNVAMARQMSQQQGSRNSTPHLQQGTPSMVQAMPNRQMTQTPRMPPGSPAPINMHQGTPTSATMSMQTPHMNGQTPQLTPEQMAMLAAQRNQQNMGMHSGSPVNMTPAEIQNITNMQRMRQQQNEQIQREANAKARYAAQVAQQNGQDPQQAYSSEIQRQRQLMIQHQQAILQNRHQQQQNMQMHGSPPGQAGSPNGMLPNQTPHIGHAHPQQQQQHQGGGGGGMPDPSQMTPQQQQHLNAQAQAKAQQVAQMRQQQQQLQQVIQPLLQQYGGRPENIPQQHIATLNPQAQAWFKQQAFRQQQARQQQHQQQLRAQQQAAAVAAANGEQVPAQQPNPQYMAQLRNNQAMLAQAAQVQQQQQQQQQGGGGGGVGGGNLNMGGMGFTMPNMGQQNFGNGQGGGGGGDLSQHFAQMQNALSRNPSGVNGGGQGMSQ